MTDIATKLKVDVSTITLRIPSTKSLSDAEKIMEQKIKWIINKQKVYRERRSELSKPNFKDGLNIPYLGHNYGIQIISHRNSKGENIKLVDDKFIINPGSADQKNHAVKIKSLYQDWLFRRAKEIFGKKINYYSKVIGIKPNKVVVKSLRNRWGSATKKGTINLNYNLLKAPEDIVNYIIIHELCHFVINDHSHHFWSLLKKYVSDYRSKIEWLEINGKYLMS